MQTCSVVCVSTHCSIAILNIFCTLLLYPIFFLFSPCLTKVSFFPNNLDKLFIIYKQFVLSILYMYEFPVKTRFKKKIYVYFVLQFICEILQTNICVMVKFSVLPHAFGLVVWHCHKELHFPDCTTRSPGWLECFQLCQMVADYCLLIDNIKGLACTHLSQEALCYVKVYITLLNGHPLPRHLFFVFCF